jgi:hypothetical protein
MFYVEVEQTCQLLLYPAGFYFIGVELIDELLDVGWQANAGVCWVALHFDNTV